MTVTMDELIGRSEAEVVATPRRRVRGLRMPVLPSGAWFAQVAGALGATCGLYLKFGLAVTLIIGGVAAVVVGALREAEKI